MWWLSLLSQCYGVDYFTEEEIEGLRVPLTASDSIVILVIGLQGIQVAYF